MAGVIASRCFALARLQDEHVRADVMKRSGEDHPLRERARAQQARVRVGVQGGRAPLAEHGRAHQRPPGEPPEIM